MALPVGPYLTRFKHKQEGLSSDGTQWLPPYTGFNDLIDDIPRALLIGCRPENQNIGPITNTSYSGTPDMRWPLTPWVGHYLAVQAMMTTTAGAGSFDLKVEVEAPVSTKVNVFNLTSSGAASAQEGTHNLASVGGVDVRGMVGWLNIYFKVSVGGTIGVLEGFVAWQGENVSNNTYKLIG